MTFTETRAAIHAIRSPEPNPFLAQSDLTPSGQDLAAFAVIVTFIAVAGFWLCVVAAGGLT